MVLLVTIVLKKSEVFTLIELPVPDFLSFDFSSSVEAFPFDFPAAPAVVFFGGIVKTINTSGPY